MIKSSSNADSVIKGLTQYQKNMPNLIREFMLKLHRMGVDMAATRLQTIVYDGSHSVTIDPSPHWESDNRLVLTAKGDEITFIEFGTGTHYVDMHEMASVLGFTRGTYGKGLGADPPWYFIEPTGTLYGNAEYEAVTSKGNLVVKTRGNPPNRVLYNTAKDLRERLLETAKEVFENG